MLRDTNRLAEAEPLYRRALEILQQFALKNEHVHPSMNIALGNYRAVLEAMHFSAEVIPARLAPFALAAPESEKASSPRDPTP